MRRKKESGNRILHWNSLASLVTENLVCRICGSEVKFTEKTVGVATEVSLCCKNKNYGVEKENYVSKSNKKMELQSRLF